ncbi:uncharacterized protein [Procambarus clarkii]|uniref:uncharacterized protein n=1 Tax=Procambarus clarkii TaxID=6728 RepID=UPI003742E323
MDVVAAILLLTGAVINVPGSVTSVSGAVTGIPGAVTGVPGAVTGIPGAVMGVSGALTGVPGVVTDVSGAVTGVPGAVTDVPGAVTDVPGAVTDVPGAVTDVPGALTGVRAPEECLCPEGSSSDASCSCPPRLKTDQPIVITLTNLSGTITAPEDPSGDHYYCTNCRVLWVLDTGAPSNTITLTIQDLFLGYPDVTIPDADLNNYTTGDFLLVGAGNDILQGNELMFFGHRQQPQKVMIPAGVGHIFLYSTVSAVDAKGFNITYNTTVEVTTEAPPSTTTRAPNIPETYVAINGIPLTDWQSYNESFKKNIAIMSNGYLRQHDFPDDVVVSEDMVFINDIKTCNPFICEENCVAYLFSVDLYIGGSIVFSKNMLDLMLADPQLQQSITNITGTSQICDEHPSESVAAYVVVPIMVVVIAVIMSLVICRCSRHDDITEKQQKYEREQQERLEDQRKRSSGIVSILGLGTDTRHGSASSGPFSKAPADDDDLNNPFDGEDIDMTDFMEYDPDFVGVNPSDFGLEKEFMTTRRPMTYYNNDAFEEDEATVYQRAPSSSHSIAATDSDDSGDGDALSFQKSTRHQKMHFIIPAEIHAKEDANETVL